jgi:hypothetical protein
MTMKINWKFVLRSVILFLVVLVLAVGGLALFLPRLTHIGPPLGPTPPPPVINAPQGEMPAELGGLTEWTQYGGSVYSISGSGFLMQLPKGAMVGVTTAHSMPMLGLPGHTLERVAFSLPDHTDFVVELDTLYGRPGIPRIWADLSVDYVLLKVNQTIDPSLALTPDSRGAPQPGERVTIYGGLGEWNGGRRIFTGTVQTVDATSVWVFMDESFEPGLLSGSPLISQHTGQVVGVAIAAGHRGDQLMIGFHPIGHIVQMAEAAEEFPPIAGYRR